MTFHGGDLLCFHSADGHKDDSMIRGSMALESLLLAFAARCPDFEDRLSHQSSWP